MKASIFTVAVAVCILLLNSYDTATAAKQTPQPREKTLWVPVDESEWAVYMDAPAYHFDCAKKYLLNGDRKSALAELKRGEAFLSFQKNRLTAALSEMENVRKAIQSSDKRDTLQFNLAVRFALNTINRKYRMLPVDVNGSSMFGSAQEYHLKKARAELTGNHRKVSAEELRQASSFLKLKAASMGITPWSKVDAAGTALEQLATKIETGQVKNVKEFDAIYADATAIFRKTAN